MGSSAEQEITMQALNLKPASNAIGQVTLPGSKSISNRTLLLSALAKGITEVHDLLISDDTQRMLEALAALGINLQQTGSNDWRIEGADGTFPIRQAELFLGNAGTAFRPLTAALAVANGSYILSGVPRMHERPIGDLVDALREAGANIEYLENQGFPPLTISPADIPIGRAHVCLQSLMSTSYAVLCWKKIHNIVKI